jgi:hypothetical protein
MLKSLTVLLVLAASIAAQTTGANSTGNLAINGAGAGTTSLATVVVSDSGFALDYTASSNVGSPFLLVIGAPFVGAIPLGPNSLSASQSVDVDLVGSPFLIPFDGITPSASSFFFRVPTSGVFSITSGGALPPGYSTIQLACVNAAAASGLDLTQAIRLTTAFGSAACGQPAGVSLGAGDDTSHIVPFTTGMFTFYGTSYSSCFVNANGNVTFGVGSSDFSPTEAVMLSGPPRIAPAWGDWSPNIHGVVRATQAGTTMAIEWFDVPTFGTAPASDSNTFCIRLFYGDGSMYMDFGRMDRAGGTYNDIVTGVSPGGGLSAANNVNISSSAGAAPGVSGIGFSGAVYETFAAGAYSPGFDLGGDVSTMTPKFHNVIPIPPGVGPYVIDQL